jgi:hypothetical protein
MNATAPSLVQQRCVNHPAREASARCPECGRFYCRECITEHDDRVLCASCLEKIARREKPAGSRWTPVMRVGLAAQKEEAHRLWAMAPRLALAFVALVIVFAAAMMVGDLLLSIPSQFHHRGGW